MVGDHVYLSLLDRLSPETQALVKQPPHAGVWVPCRHIDELWRTALEHAFGGDLSKMSALGCLSQHRDLKTIYKVFIRVSSPSFVVRKAAQLYGTYWRNCGAAEAHMLTANRVEVRFINHPTPSAALWATFAGYTVDSLQTSGCKNVQVELVNGGGDSPSCVYQATWMNEQTNAKSP